MNKYINLSKEELLRLIEKQEQELKNKKYGLVWDSEREPEQVVLDCANHLPILKRVKSKEIKTDDSEDNILIEGDNYHALTVLNYTHKGKIDVIYIDPPYNTGNKSWKYNNNYVEKDDGYRHSKWLNMMEKRLNIAKKLLKENGVLIVAIDENEFANLYLLLTKIFANYKIDQVVIVHNPRGVQGKNFSYTHEYALFVYPNDGKMYIGDIEREDILTEELRDHGGNSLRTDAKNCFYPIFVKDNKIIGFGEVPEDSFHPTSKNITKENGIIEVWPIDKNGIERKWVFARDSIHKIKNKLLVKEKENNLIDIYRIKDTQKPRTVWIGQKYDASTWGSKIVKQITGQDFPYPKSIFTVKDCISIVCKNKKDAIILDFFAGSGTTGHAVLDLNKEDGGNRRFILVTNNEGNIATEVCYPRVKKVIKGYEFKGKDKQVLYEKKLTFTQLKKIDEILEEINQIIEENKANFDKIEKEFKDNTIKIIGVKNIDGFKKGLGGNLQYFKTSLIKKSKNRDQVKIDLTQKATEMLCVKENIYNLEKEGEDYKIFSSNKKDRFLCIYYNFIDDSFDEFLEELKKLDGKKIIYMFAIDNKVDKSLFSELDDFTIEPIPQKILDVYNQLVKMNIPIKVETIFIDLEKAKKQIFDNEDKDTGAKILRVVLEKLLQKIAQLNQINILNDKGKEIKISNLNDILKARNVLSQVEWQENQIYLSIGNHASHGEYDEYNLEQVKNFYKHIQSLIDKFNI